MLKNWKLVEPMEDVKPEPALSVSRDKKRRNTVKKVSCDIPEVLTSKVSLLGCCAKSANWQLHGKHLLGEAARCGDPKVSPRFKSSCLEAEKEAQIEQTRAEKDEEASQHPGLLPERGKMKLNFSCGVTKIFDLKHILLVKSIIRNYKWTYLNPQPKFFGRFAPLFRGGFY